MAEIRLTENRLLKSSRFSQILRRSYPFLVVLGIEAIFILYLIAGHRGVIGHDAFQYFSLQYYFLNNAVNSGDTAQWMPLMTHGTVSNWWYAVQAGIVQSAMLAMGPFSRVLMGWNFLPIYYLGILFDLFVLLLGVWLLGRRYFASNLTVLFVCISAVGSATWFTQPWHNLHFYFALPLIFNFIHQLFERGQWRYFLLAANLFALQCFGSLPYYIPLTSLITVLYTLFYILFYWTTSKGELKRLAANWRNAIAPVALALASVYVVITLLTAGTDLIANYNVGREPDGSVTLDTFLTYGTNSNLRWFELISRVSPSLDYSLYFGYLALAFAVLALLLKRTKPLLVIASTTLVVLLIANATPVATLFYYIWPTMQYFRHLSLASTIVRLMLCIIAGFGFEQLLLAPAREHRVKLRIAILAMAEFTVMLFIFSRSYERSIAWIGSAILGTLRNDRTVLEEAYLLSSIVSAALWCLAATAFFVLVASRRVSPRTAAVIAIAFQGLDIYSFKHALSQVRTIPLTPEQYEVSRLQEMPYTARRMSIEYDSHPRARYVPQNYYRADTDYWTADSYMFTDPPSNRGRADHWLWSFDDSLRAYAGEALRDLKHKPAAYRPYDSFLFPTGNVTATKAAGISEDKIQFFSKAHEISSDDTIARILGSDSFRGDILLVSTPRDGAPVSGSENERLQLSYEVTRYESDSITIRIPGATAGAWLYYADCWHPSWQASVNGKDVPVRKANLAYKAVQLDDGENIVQFRFHSSPLWFSISAVNWMALAWVILVPCLAAKTMLGEFGDDGN